MSRAPERTPVTPSDKIELPSTRELKRLKLSPEVAWYLLSRGYELPKHPPLYKTPEGGADPAAVFDPEAVDLVIQAMRNLRHTQGRWAGQPLEPDAWQVAYVLAPVFGWLRLNDSGRWVRVVRSCYLDVPRKNGKALAVTTPILTDRGWTTMGDLRVGDRVHGGDGALTRIVATSEIFNDHACYQVSLSDGRTIVADAGHLWTVRDRYRQRVVTVDTESMAANFLVGNRTTHRERRYSLPAQPLVERAEAVLPIDPYLLGAWLGDGHSAAARITGIDQEIIDRFRAHFEVRHISGPTWSIVGGFLVALRELGVLGNKHVPEVYLTASVGQRLELLRGLMDTDGTVGRGSGSPRCEFTSTRRELAEAVLQLARSLGWKATLREGVARLNGRPIGPKFRVSWNAYADLSPFHLDRKTSRLAQRPERPTRSATVQVVDVQQVPTVATRCIQVEAEDGLFLAGRGFIPTHNSTLAGGIALYLTGADGEHGAQVVAAAASKTQAGFVFNPIKQLAQKSPSLKGRFRPLTGKILHPTSGSEFSVVASVGDTQHGANVHGAIIDELHVHKTRDLVDAIETGTGAREQPLVMIITTPDDGKPNTIYASKRRLIEQLSKGVLKDPATYGVVFGLPDHANPLKIENLAKANPGYPISPTHDYLASAITKAKTGPVELNVFKRLHAGQRTKQTTTYLDLKKWNWNKLPGPLKPTPVDHLEGRQAFGGLDLGAVSDLTALCWLLPEDDGYRALWRFWCPEAALPDLDARTSGQASKAWVKEGWLTSTSGDVTDYDFVQAQILADAEVLDVTSIGLDMWNATQLSNDLLEEGLPIVKVRQGFATMSPAMKEIKRRMLLRQLRHDGNPVAQWCVDNLAVAIDPAGNVKPDKANSADKIDGVSALANAISEAMSGEHERSAYDQDHGLMVV